MSRGPALAGGAFAFPRQRPPDCLGRMIAYYSRRSVSRKGRSIIYI
jgi:hypothetical protein